MASRLVTWACSGASGSSAGAGTVAAMTSKSASRPGSSGMSPSAGRLREARPARPRGVDDREVEQAGGDGLVELQLVGQLQQELEALVDDLGAARVGPVGLVDHQHDGQARHQRLAQHETGLRQRAFAGVDEQEHAVDHGQAALDLAAEIGVPRRVDDVDRHAAPVDRRVLGEDRDALLTLEVAGIHHAVDDGGPLAERARGTQHRVDQRGLAVVDVRHDGDVAQARAGPPGCEGRVRGRGEGGSAHVSG